MAMKTIMVAAARPSKAAACRGRDTGASQPQVEAATMNQQAFKMFSCPRRCVRRIPPVSYSLRRARRVLPGAVASVSRGRPGAGGDSDRRKKLARPASRRTNRARPRAPRCIPKTPRPDRPSSRCCPLVRESRSRPSSSVPRAGLDLLSGRDRRLDDCRRVALQILHGTAISSVRLVQIDRSSALCAKCRGPSFITRPWRQDH